MPTKQQKSEARATSFTLANAPPGKVIKELMESRNVDPIDLAYALDLTHAQFNDLLIGELPLTLELAEVLGRVFHQPPEMWLNCETNFRNQKS